MTAGQSSVVVGQSSDTHDDPSTMNGRSTSNGKKGGVRLKRNRYMKGGSANNNSNDSLTNGTDDNEYSMGATNSDSGINRVRWTRPLPRPAILRRSLSGPEDNGRGSTFGSRRQSPRTPTSETNNKSKSGFRLGRPRLKLGRSHSLPTEHVRLSGDVGGSSTMFVLSSPLSFENGGMIGVACVCALVCES